MSLDLASCAEFELFLTPDITARADRFYVSDVMFTRLPFEDWATLESPDYGVTLAEIYRHRQVPHFCVFSDPGSAQDVEAADARSGARAAKVRMLTLALRLLTKLDPPALDPTDYISYRRAGGFIAVQASLAGRHGYTLSPRMVVDHLVELWTQAYDSLQFLNRFRSCESLELALDLFYRAGGLGVGSSDSEVLLHAALEALCGADIGRLAEVRWGDPEVSEAVRTRKIRRNALVHGQLIGSKTSRVPLRRLVSWVILESVHQVLLDPAAPQATGAGLIESLKGAGAFGARRLYEIPTDAEELLYRGLDANHERPRFVTRLHLRDVSPTGPLE